jgi:ketosteroid isomerase-like protein
MSNISKPRSANANAVALDQAYRIWIDSRGTDSRGFVALMDDDIVVRSVLLPDVPTQFAGSRSGKEAARAYLDAIHTEWIMEEFAVEKFVADGGDVVMVGRCVWSNIATGRKLDSPLLDLWHFENGKATDFLEMFDSHEFIQALPATADAAPGMAPPPRGETR